MKNCINPNCECYGQIFSDDYDKCPCCFRPLIRVEEPPPPGSRPLAGLIGGALLGWAIGGPIGALIGAIIGGSLGAAVEETERQVTQSREYRRR